MCEKSIKPVSKQVSDFSKSVCEVKKKKKTRKEVLLGDYDNLSIF